MSCNDNKLSKEVSIEYPLFQSQKGRYFIGETPILTGPTSKAIVALVNPTTSNVNIYLNAITVSNVSSESLSAEIYLRSSIPVGDTSSYVSCTNVSITPPSKPRGLIKFNDLDPVAPIDGVPIFSRIVPPYSTTVIDGGQIIIPPKSCILVYLGGFLPIQFDSAIVAFGWWEEKIDHKHCEY